MFFILCKLAWVDSYYLTCPWLGLVSAPELMLCQVWVSDGTLLITLEDEKCTH